MPKPQRVGDLEITQDLPHERLEWRLERIGWSVMALVLLAALAGLLGPGPLSRATAGEPGAPLWVEYHRFARYQAPAMLRVHLGPGTARAGQARLWLNRDYVEHIELLHIDPEPEKVEVLPDRLLYIFNVPDPARPTAVTYYFEANTYGHLPLRVGLEAGPQLAVSQFYYP
jgi:hypothetical protein